MPREINKVVENVGPSIVKASIKDDWCHLCGKRGERCFVEVFYPDNAEHPEPGQRNVIPNARYVRICDLCFDEAKVVADYCMSQDPPERCEVCKSECSFFNNFGCVGCGDSLNTFCSYKCAASKHNCRAGYQPYFSSGD